MRTGEISSSQIQINHLRTSTTVRGRALHTFHVGENPSQGIEQQNEPKKPTRHLHRHPRQAKDPQSAILQQRPHETHLRNQLKKTTTREAGMIHHSSPGEPLSAEVVGFGIQRRRGGTEEKRYRQNRLGWLEGDLLQCVAFTAAVLSFFKEIRCTENPVL